MDARRGPLELTGTDHLRDGSRRKAGDDRGDEALSIREPVALPVGGPRFLEFLAADVMPIAAAAEHGLLVVAGIGTALVLTGGNLYLPHPVAQIKAWRRTLAATWIAVLAASGGLGRVSARMPLTPRNLSFIRLTTAEVCGSERWA
jgi:hypothetical protein